jgi:lysozyme family protein
VTAFDLAVQHTLEAEGLFSDHTWDPGGATKYGITEAVARRHGHDVRELTREQAVAIYRADYWDALGLDEVAAVSTRVALEVFDTAVNTGLSRAARIAQEALREVFEADLEIDGKLGPQTRAALIRAARRYEQQLVAALNLYQGAFYVHLLRRKHPAARPAIKGWMRRLETPPA